MRTRAITSITISSCSVMAEILDLSSRVCVWICHYIKMVIAIRTPSGSAPAVTGFGIDRTVPVTVIQSGPFAVSLGLLPATLYT